MTLSRARGSKRGALHGYTHTLSFSPFSLSLYFFPFNSLFLSFIFLLYERLMDGVLLRASTKTPFLLVFYFFFSREFSLISFLCYFPYTYIPYRCYYTIQYLYKEILRVRVGEEQCIEKKVFAIGYCIHTYIHTFNIM